MTEDGGRRPLRVAAAPSYVREPDGNPFSNLLTTALVEQGARVDQFSLRTVLASRYDVLHVHWPEWAFNLQPHGSRIWRSIKLLAAASWTRWRGGKLFWTVHNLVPHDRTDTWGSSLFWRLYRRRVDAFISLTQSGVEAVRDRFPELRETPAFFVPPGHYRDSYPASVPRDAARERLGLSDASTVCLFFGLVRPYKNIPTLIRAFRQFPDPACVLVIAGRPVDDETRREVAELAAADPRIRLHLDFVADHDVPLYFAAADLVALPYAETFNSGAALLALSFNRPMLGPARGAFPELRDNVGEQWVHVYEGELTTAALGDALAKAVATDIAGPAPLDEFEWPDVARRTIEAYRSVIDGDRPGGAGNGRAGPRAPATPRPG